MKGCYDHMAKKSKKKSTKNKNKELKNTPTKTRGVNIPDPCFHCRNMELSSNGWSCKENCDAFWNDPQGFEIDPKTELASILCRKFDKLPKPLRPSLI